MKHPDDERATRAWLLLTAGTLATWGLGAAGLAGPWLAAAVLTIAVAKGRLLVLDFMELRGAPRVWRVVLEGWLLLVGALVLIAYAIGLK
ncbi:MAG: cytochrome C oxidase subunit IV family protein [Rhodocyclaceae bacterium]|nr:cytochrome C oxidase subunit IV family protein [Rhodocyclaceae bacterium]